MTNQSENGDALLSGGVDDATQETDEYADIELPEYTGWHGEYGSKNNPGEQQYEQCDDCGSEEARVYYANRQSCLVAECANCGSQITALQAGVDHIVD